MVTDTAFHTFHDDPGLRLLRRLPRRDKLLAMAFEHDGRHCERSEAISNVHEVDITMVTCCDPAKTIRNFLGFKDEHSGVKNFLLKNLGTSTPEDNSNPN